MPATRRGAPTRQSTVAPWIGVPAASTTRNARSAGRCSRIGNGGTTPDAAPAVKPSADQKTPSLRSRCSSTPKRTQPSASDAVSVQEDGRLRDLALVDEPDPRAGDRRAGELVDHARRDEPVGAVGVARLGARVELVSLALVEDHERGRRRRTARGLAAEAAAPARRARRARPSRATMCRDAQVSAMSSHRRS